MSEPDLTPAQLALLAQRLRGRRVPLRSDIAPFPPAETGSLPLSAEQEQIYFDVVFAPGNPVYNEAITFRKLGPLDLDALRTAFNQLAARYDIWHTTFRRVGRHAHQVVGPAATFPLPLHDLSGLAAAERQTRVTALVAEEAGRGYDLKRGPLLRPLLVRFDENHHRLYLALHHVIFDGVSLYRIVLPELVALYDAAAAGRPARLPAAVQYADYVRWQQAGALEEELRRHLPYWRDRLAGAPTLRLPIERARPAQQRFHGTLTAFEVPAEMVAGLRESGHRAGTTLFHVLAAAFALLLHECTGDEDVLFATVADRRRRPEFESMVGYCVTPMVLRLRVSTGMAVATLVRGVREEMLDGLAHLVPFERLVRDLDPPRQPGRTPLVQAMLVLEPPAVRAGGGWSLHQLDAGIGSVVGNAKMDFQMELDERPEGHLAGRLIVNPDLFGPAFGVRMVDRWQSLLTGLVDEQGVGPPRPPRPPRDEQAPARGSHSRTGHRHHPGVEPAAG